MTPAGLTSVDDRKRAAAESAVAEVEPGMLVGLGTGSTAAFAISALAARVADGLRVSTVATSLRSAEMALAAGIRVLNFADTATVDLCIDGVDEIDPALRAIKGAGGAMLREKIVATSAARMIAIADDSKTVAQLGARPVPIEFLSFARAFVERRVAELGGAPALRLTGSGQPYQTDQGNPVFDVSFGPIADPQMLGLALSACPGVLGHGLFVTEIDILYLGMATGIVRHGRVL